MNAEISTINKQEVINYLEGLNKFKMVKVNNSNKERLVFINSSEIFNIYGSEAKEVLTPFNDYTYNWLNSFLSNVIDLINRSDFSDFDELSEMISEELHEWADSETDIYTSDLTEWLNDSNVNQYYLTEASKEGYHDNLLMVAQYKAIEELFYNALPCLIDDLKNQFN
jgi:hypothetical protein